MNDERLCHRRSSAAISQPSAAASSRSQAAARGRALGAHGDGGAAVSVRLVFDGTGEGKRAAGAAVEAIAAVGFDVSRPRESARRDGSAALYFEARRQG